LDCKHVYDYLDITSQFRPKSEVNPIKRAFWCGLHWIYTGCRLRLHRY